MRAPPHPPAGPGPDPFPLLTPRVRVRRLRGDDLAAFQAMRHDPEVGRWQGWTPVDDATATAFLSAMATGPWHRPGQWTQLALAHRDTDRLFGDIGLHWPPSPDAPLEIGFSLARDAQGRGLAHEAVAATLAALAPLGVARGCVATTDTRNTASERLLARLGFAKTRLRSATFQGAPCDETDWRLPALAGVAAAPVASSPPGPPALPDSPDLRPPLR